jgi:hypothetical protein
MAAKVGTYSTQGRSYIELAWCQCTTVRKKNSLTRQTFTMYFYQIMYVLLVVYHHKFRVGFAQK